MKWLQKLTGGYSSSAKVVDGSLILSLPDAVSPVVWRMELGSVRSSALEVREKEGMYVLTLKTPKGDVSDVAPFFERGRAIRALMAVSSAMQGAHGEMRPRIANDESPAEAAPPRRRRKGGAAAGIIGILILAVLVVAMVRLSPSGMHMPAPGETAEATSTNGQAGADATGVPLSADDYLLKRQ